LSPAVDDRWAGDLVGSREAQTDSPRIATHPAQSDSQVQVRGWRLYWRRVEIAVGAEAGTQCGRSFMRVVERRRRIGGEGGQALLDLGGHVVQRSMRDVGALQAL